MDRTAIRRIGWVTASLGLTTALVGCGELATDATTDDSQQPGAALAYTNGLANVNGLANTNGLAGVNGLANTNGLALTNGLAYTNGLAATNGLMTTDWGRKTVAYIARCALAAGDSIVKQDQYGANFTFSGAIGLCPAWKTGGIGGNDQCQETISACLMAHVNTAGIHIPIWLDSGATAIGWGLNSAYPFQEGTFFGNILTTGALPGHGNVNGPVGNYCEGDGFATGSSGVVAGRIGAGQSGVPYTNPWGTGTLCKNTSGMVPQYSNGTGQGNPDGYKALTANGTTWNYMITVWRPSSYSANFDSGYKYSFTALNTRAAPLLVDAPSNSDYAGVVQAAQSSNLASSKWQLATSGTGWKMMMSSDMNKCLDSNNGALNAQVVVRSCNGGTSQQWLFQMNGGYGSGYIKNVATNLCLMSSSNTATGSAVTLGDCSRVSWQEFRIVAAQ